MSKQLVYFIGGSHDLSKQWIEKYKSVVEMAVRNPTPHVVAVSNLLSNLGAPCEAVFKIERYAYRCRCKSGAVIYELIDE